MGKFWEYNLDILIFKNFPVQTVLDMIDNKNLTACFV